jgi:hypothetical protein
VAVACAGAGLARALERVDRVAHRVACHARLVELRRLAVGDGAALVLVGAIDVTTHRAHEREALVELRGQRVERVGPVLMEAAHAITSVMG